MLVGLAPDQARVHGEAVTLTGDGTAAHVELFRRINETRGVVLQGLSPEQYVETVRILTV